MVIDCHTHVGFENKFEKQTTEQLIALMDFSGVEKSVIFPFGPLNKIDSYFESNENLKQHNSSRFIPFGRINLLSEDFMHEIGHIASLGLKGIKLHHTSGENFSEYPEFFKKLDKVKLPIIIHTGNTANTSVKTLRNIPCSASPVIIAHGGKDDLLHAIDLVNTRDNFYIETSLLSLIRTARLINDVKNKNKILFGSDAPYHHPALEIGKIRHACVSLGQASLAFHILRYNFERICKNGE